MRSLTATTAGQQKGLAMLRYRGATWVDFTRTTTPLTQSRRFAAAVVFDSSSKASPQTNYVTMGVEGVLHTIKSLHQTHSSSATQHLGARAVVSASQNVYENLAVEEAIMRAVVLVPVSHNNYNDGCKPTNPLNVGGGGATDPQLQLLMFSYINSPCAVIGRNQCVFTEVNVPLCTQRGALVARRSSGGGTVFHDAGNVNFTFFTHRHSYDPVRTIGILMRFLIEHFSIDPRRLTTTGRHDIFLDGCKITGSAMRIQKDVAFHHCTLLVASNRAALRGSLGTSGDYVNVSTKSTTSVRSPVTTLRDAGVLELVGGDDKKETELDAAKRIQAAFLTFVLNHGLDVYAATRLGSDAVAAAVASGQETQVHHNMLWPGSPLLHRSEVFSTLLVASTDDIASTPFIEGEGRKVPPRSHSKIAEEIAMLSSPEWIYGAMPSLEVTVRVHKSDVNQCLSERMMGSLDAPRISGFLNAMIKFTFGGPTDANTAILCRVMLERGIVTSAHWFPIAPSSGEEPSTSSSDCCCCWFDPLLSAYTAGRGVNGVRDGLPLQGFDGVIAELYAMDPTALWDQVIFAAADSSASRELEDAMNNVHEVRSESAGTKNAWMPILPHFLRAIIHCSIGAAGLK